MAAGEFGEHAKVDFPTAISIFIPLNTISCSIRIFHQCAFISQLRFIQNVTRRS